jgi:hypothetical protein
MLAHVSASSGQSSAALDATVIRKGSGPFMNVQIASRPELVRSHTSASRAQQVDPIPHPPTVTQHPKSQPSKDPGQKRPSPLDQLLAIRVRLARLESYLERPGSNIALALAVRARLKAQRSRLLRQLFADCPFTTDIVLTDTRDAATSALCRT